MARTKDFAATPAPPYYAVIFASLRNAGDDGYQKMAAEMSRLAAEQPGHLGHESARDENGFGITVSYWKDEASLVAWKNVAEHVAAQIAGRDRWYRHYELRVAKVERAYSGPEGRSHAFAAASALD